MKIIEYKEEFINFSQKPPVVSPDPLVIDPKFKGKIKGKYVIIEEDVEIGEGSEIWNYVHIRKGTKIGKNTRIGDFCHIGRDVIVGDGCKIQNRADIFKGVEIGDDVFIGPNVTFTNVRRPKATHQVPVSSYIPTKVGNGSSIGANCTIVCGAELGDHSFINAGATVLGNQKVPAGTTAYGGVIKQYPRTKEESYKMFKINKRKQ